MSKSRPKRRKPGDFNKKRAPSGQPPTAQPQLQKLARAREEELMSKSASHRKSRKPAANAPDNPILPSFAEYVCNDPLAKEPWLGGVGTKIPVTIKKEDLGNIRKLGDRWLLIIDDIHPARGPSGSGALPEVFAKVTFAALAGRPPSDGEFVKLFAHAEAGARVAVIFTEPAYLGAWDTFLKQRTRAVSTYAYEAH